MKAELRKLALRLVRDEMDLYPTKMPLVTIIEAYVEYIRYAKTKSCFKVDTWYLSDMFGPICPSLEKDEKSRRGQHRNSK